MLRIWRSDESVDCSSTLPSSGRELDLDKTLDVPLRRRQRSTRRGKSDEDTDLLGTLDSLVTRHCDVEAAGVVVELLLDADTDVDDFADDDNTGEDDDDDDDDDGDDDDDDDDGDCEEFREESAAVYRKRRQRCRKRQVATRARGNSAIWGRGR